MITEKEFRTLCKKHGCHCPEFYKVTGKYANIPECLRLYCCLMEERSRGKK